MRRREVITLIGGAFAAWPAFAGAEQAGKSPTIAYFGGVASFESSWLDGLVRRLGELGWIEEQTVDGVIGRRACG